MSESLETVNIKVPGDMLLCSGSRVPRDPIIGNTYAEYIAKDEDIPLVRHGFPIYDRMGHSYFSTMSYSAVPLRLMEKNCLMPSWTARTATPTISRWNWSCKSDDGRQKHKVTEDELRTAETSVLRPL